MKSIKQLALEMNDLEGSARNARFNILKEAVEIMRKKLQKSKKFKKMLDDLGNSKDLTCVEHDDCFHQWIRVNFRDFIDTTSEFEKEVFQLTLDEMETYAIADFKNDCITMGIGLNIIVNWSPSHNEYFVYDQDSGKEIITKDQVLNEDGEIDRGLTCKSIENWMETNGYFPSVIEIDYYGNPVGYINTREVSHV